MEAWFNPSKELIEVAGQTIDASPIQQQQQSAEAIQIDWTGHESNEKAGKADCVKAKDFKLGADHIQSDENDVAVDNRDTHKQMTGENPVTRTQKWRTRHKEAKPADTTGFEK